MTFLSRLTTALLNLKVAYLRSLSAVHMVLKANFFFLMNLVWKIYDARTLRNYDLCLPSLRILIPRL